MHPTPPKSQASPTPTDADQSATTLNQSATTLNQSATTLDESATIPDQSAPMLPVDESPMHIKRPHSADQSAMTSDQSPPVKRSLTIEASPASPTSPQSRTTTPPPTMAPSSTLTPPATQPSSNAVSAVSNSNLFTDLQPTPSSTLPVTISLPSPKVEIGEDMDHNREEFENPAPSVEDMPSEVGDDEEEDVADIEPPEVEAMPSEVCGEVVEVKPPIVETMPSEIDLSGRMDFGNYVVDLLQVIKIHHGVFGADKYIQYLLGALCPTFRFYRTSEALFGSSIKEYGWWFELIEMLKINKYLSQHELKFDADRPTVVLSMTPVAKVWLKEREMNNKLPMMLRPTETLAYIMDEPTAGAIDRTNMNDMAMQYTICKRLGKEKQRNWFDRPHNGTKDPRYPLPTGRPISYSAREAYNMLISGKMSAAEMTSKFPVKYPAGLLFSYFSYAIYENGFGLPLDALCMDKDMVNKVHKIVFEECERDITDFRPIMDSLPADTMTYEQLKVCVAILSYEYDVEDVCEEVTLPKFKLVD